MQGDWFHVCSSPMIKSTKIKARNLLGCKYVLDSRELPAGVLFGNIIDSP